jgi:hypothetical protein
MLLIMNNFNLKIIEAFTIHRSSILVTRTIQQQSVFRANKDNISETLRMHLELVQMRVELLQIRVDNLQDQLFQMKMKEQGTISDQTMDRTRKELDELAQQLDTLKIIVAMGFVVGSSFNEKIDNLDKDQKQLKVQVTALQFVLLVSGGAGALNLTGLFPWFKL